MYGVLSLTKIITRILATDGDNIRSVTSASDHGHSSYDDDSICTTTTDSAAIYYNTDGTNTDDNSNHSANFANEHLIADPLNQQLTVAERVALIKIKTNCSLTTVSAISKLLRDLGHNIPKDARTIMKTKVRDSSHNCSDEQRNSNSFIHLGLVEGIKKKLPNADKKLKKLILQFNIDGLPLWRSSRTEFWPIVCRIINAQDGSEFLVSLQCGVGKPHSINSYLKPMLTEIQKLLEDGLHYFGQRFEIEISAFCCDAPARSFIKQIIGHMGYIVHVNAAKHMESDVVVEQLTPSLQQP